MATTPGTNNEAGEDITSKYEEILKKNGVTKTVSEVIVKDAGLQGEGFGSQQLYITVKFENPEVAQLNLFGKAVTRNASHTKMIREWKSFEKEAGFFIKYIPAAEKLCKEKGQLELLDIYPKCYHGDDELILLENLVLDKGYTVQRKDDKQGLDEAKAAILTLAKHHAISYAMIQNHGGSAGFFKTFKNFDFDHFKGSSMRQLIEPMFVKSVINNRTLLEKHPAKGRDVALERLKTEGESAFEIFVKNLELNKDDEPFILCHGDYHGNNMMFLRDPETGKVLHQKAIDLQGVRYNSTAVDIACYLFFSVKPEVRRAHLKELLNFYLENFNKVCSNLGSPIEYPFEEFFLQFRRKFKHGFWLGFLSIGPPHEAIKEVNISDMKNPADLSLLFDKAAQKWLNENPDEGEKIAKQVVEVLEEYYELRLDN